MKKMRLIAILVCLCMCIAPLAGCGNSSDSNTSPAPGASADPGSTPAAGEPRWTIGVSQANVAAGPYYGTYQDSLVETAAELGVELVLMDANSDAIAQNDQIDDLIQKGVDGMIVWPVNDQTVVPAFERVYNAGIPLVDADVPMPEEAYPYMVAFSGPDHFQQAYQSCTLACDALVERDGEGATFNVVELMGMPGDFSSTTRSNGFASAIADANAKYGEGTFVLMEQQPTEFSRQKAQEVMEDYLHKYDDIDLVICCEGGIAYGALKAIQENGRAVGYENDGIVIAEASAQSESYLAMQEGLIYSSTEQDPALAAVCCLTLLVDYLDGVNTEPELLNYVPTPAYTMYEVDDYWQPVY